MMRYLILSLTLMVAMLAACAPQPSADEPVSSDPEQPVAATPGGDGAFATPESPYAPQADDAKLSEGKAFVENVNMFIMESFPPQIGLGIDGSLPTPCHALRIRVNAPDADNVVNVDVYSVVDPELICTQVLQEFSINTNLGTFPAGLYTLKVNGETVGTFNGQ